MFEKEFGDYHRLGVLSDFFQLSSFTVQTIHNENNNIDEGNGNEKTDSGQSPLNVSHESVDSFNLLKHING